MLVTLPDGTAVFAQGRLDIVPSHRPLTPDFALYLDHRWAGDPEVRWPFELIDWPDFGLPLDEQSLFRAVVGLHERTVAGNIVEVACYGGVGRTGTVLACLAVLAATPPADALDWVRRAYHHSAVETDAQAALVSRFAVWLEAT